VTAEDPQGPRKTHELLQDLSTNTRCDEVELVYQLQTCEVCLATVLIKSLLWPRPNVRQADTLPFCVHSTNLSIPYKHGPSHSNVLVDRCTAPAAGF